MNIIANSGINTIHSYSFFVLYYPNYPFFVGKFITSKITLNDILLSYKNNSKSISKKSLNVFKFMNIYGTENIQISLLCEAVSTTEDRSIRIKNSYIDYFIKCGYKMQNELYYGSTYKMIQQDLKTGKFIDIYIGSTKLTLKQRMIIHFSDAETDCPSLIYDYMRKLKAESLYIYNNLKLELIEFHQLESRNELRCMEQRCIEDAKTKTNYLQNELNAIQLTDLKERRLNWFSNNPKYYKEYREKNKEKLTKYRYGREDHISRLKSKRISNLISQGKFTFNCFYCNESMYKNLKSDHVKSLKHCQNVKNYYEIFKNITNNLISNDDDNNKIEFSIWYEKLGEYGQKEYNLWKNGQQNKLHMNKIYHCFYCDSNIFKNSLKDHWVSEKHFSNINRWNNYFESNYKNIKNDENSIRKLKSCMIFPIQILFDNWLQNPIITKEKINETKNYCSYCNINMISTNVHKHLKTLNHQQNVKNKNEFFQNEFNKKIAISENSLKEWYNSMSDFEKQMFNTWFNNPKKSDEIIPLQKHTCNYCNIQVVKSGKSKHELTDNHRLNTVKWNNWFETNYKHYINCDPNNLIVWINNLNDPIKELYNIWYKEKLIQNK